VRAETRWALAAFGLTTAVAVVDVLMGERLILIGLFIAGPMLAAVRLDGPRTGLVAAYALGLAVAVGPFDGTWGTPDHFIRCSVVAVGGGFATAIAYSRSSRERRLAQITRVAEVAQRAILRPIPARLGDMTFATRYLSAAEEALIGGDFYDAAFTPRGLRLIVGDVRGKGLAAVQLASVVLGSFREAAFAEADLPGLVAALNRRVDGALGEEDFVTVVLVEFGPQGWLRLVNCGHPPPLLVAPTGRRSLEPGQPTPPLGLHPTPVVERVRLGPEDRLLLYTDGLVEARAADGGQFELDDRVEACLTAASLHDALDGLVELLLAHAGGRLNDDLALVLVAPAGTPASRASPGSPQDLDEQHPRIQHRHHQAEEDAGDKPVEAATGTQQQRHPFDQQRHHRHLNHDDPTGQDAR
jgi:phosphoserine phosphatase RsbU/P